MKNLICFIICMSTVLVLKAQDAKADFKKINEAYNTSTSLSMDIKYELFLDGAAAPYETEQGRYMKLGSKYYNKQGSNELIITDTYMFVVDKDNKILAADHKIDEKKIANPLSLNLDSLYAMYTKIEQIKTDDPAIAGYRFYVKQGPYSVCEVYYNIRTHFVVEIRNTFRNKITGDDDKLHSAILKTSFTHIEDKVTDPGIFADNRYILKNNKQYSLASLYKTYKFINHLK